MEVIVCMLQAKSNEGILITLAHLSQTEIEYYRKNTQFYCPTCHQAVIIKAGRRVIPHFAHHPETNCLINERGEGTYHETGKLFLYQWLRSQGLNVELEKYIKHIKQQPDILLVLNQKRIAIEFQCARIPIEQILSRNEGYKKIGITPIWILGANCFKQHNQNALKLDQFTLQFIHQFTNEHPLKLFFFCPNTLNFITFTDIYMTHNRYALGSLQFNKLHHLIFTDLFKRHYLAKETLYQLWKREKKKFRLKPRNASFGKARAWQHYLYLKRTHVEHLPSIVYLPVSHQLKMKTPLWDWQSRLFLEILNPLSIGEQFTLQKCEFILKNHIHRQQFSLILSSSNPIVQYLQLIKKLNYIEEVSPNTYTKIKSIHNHSHIETSIQDDEMIMDELIAINKLNSSMI